MQNRFSIIKVFLFIALIINTSLHTIAQNGANMKVHFVAPTAVINASFPGHANVSGVGLPAGYDIAEITAANAAVFTGLAPTRLRYVYQQLQPGTDLRRRLNTVQFISRDSVQVNYYLVDDRTGLTAGAGGNFLPRRIYSRTVATDTLLHVWPTGNGFSIAGGRYQGRVRLGEYQMDKDAAGRTGGIMAIQELVLHETFHTQLVNRWTKWNGYVTNNEGRGPITYGGIAGHTIDEILGDQEAAINEGSGTFYGYTINGAGLTDLDIFFANAGYRYILEGQSVCALYRELYTVTTRRQRTLAGQIVYDYKWLDVPGFFNLFNENNATSFFANYWRSANANRDTALSFLNYTFNAMWKDTLKRYLTYACNRLALKMEAYNATPAGIADTSKTSSLFPFALLDLITHFGMPDAEYRADYERNYPNANPRAYAVYFTRRNAIKTLVQADMAATPIRFTEALRKIVVYCKNPANMP